MLHLAPATSIQSIADAPSLVTNERGDHLHVIGRGVWSTTFTENHFAEFERLLMQLRSTGGQVRILVDLRLAAVQSDAVNTQIATWTKRLYRRGDRVALVLASSLAKAAMRRVTMAADREFFLSEDAARLWLGIAG
jgi:hypothetical protein